MKQHLVYFLKSVSIAVLVSIALGADASWVDNTTAPPGANALAPIHTGVDQTKSGGLTLTSILATASASILGNLGVGVASPTAKLDVAGTVKATGLLLPTGSGLGKVLTSDASGNATWGTASVSGMSGTGTTGYIPKFTGTSAVGNSELYSNGTALGINTTTIYGSGTRLQVNGGVVALAASFGPQFTTGGQAPDAAVTAMLEVNGRARFNSIQLTTGGSLGRVLVYGSSGDATWSSVTAPLTSNGTTIALGTVPVANGGTGATTAAGARTNLGLGTVSTLSTNANAGTYLNGSGAWTTPASGGSGTITGVTAGTGLTGGGTTGIVTLNVGTVAVANGGTGATTPAVARTNLGVGNVGTLNTNGLAGSYLSGAGTWMPTRTYFVQRSVTGSGSPAFTVLGVTCDTGDIAVGGSGYANNNNYLMHTAPATCISSTNNVCTNGGGITYDVSQTVSDPNAWACVAPNQNMKITCHVVCLDITQ